MTGPLPYTDTKSVGAADFYFAINATFRFIRRQLGEAALHQYWTDLGSRYFAPVSLHWKTGNIPAVANYWRAFFAAEPGAEVTVTEASDHVLLDVRVCPAIAQPAGLTVRVLGGNGSCHQTFAATQAPQDLADIREAI